MVPSNFRLVVESRGRDHFDAVMKMAFDAFDKAAGYNIDDKGFHLYWSVDAGSGSGNILPLPYKMSWKAAADFVWGWVQTVDRGPEPGIDGSCQRDGFVVEHVPFGWGYEFVRVQAVWSLYHK